MATWGVRQVLQKKEPLFAVEIWGQLRILSRETRQAVKVLFLLTLPLAAASIVFYFTQGLHWLYLGTAVVLGLAMICANIRLLFSANSHDAWKVYKLSAFPYLGLIFLAMCLDAWLLVA